MKMKNIEEARSYGNKSGIYYIVLNLDKRVYIGSSSNIGKRLRAHYTDLTSNLHKNNYLQRTWNKNNGDDFTFGIIEFCQPDVLLIREQYWMDFFKSMKRDRGFNLSPVAGSTLGIKKTEQQINNFKKAIQGKHTTNLTMEEASIVKVQINRGTPLSEISKLMNVSYDTIRSIRRGLTFKYVDPQINYEDNKSAILNEEIVIQIKKEINLGVKVKDLAEKYNVNHRTISLIKNEKSWKGIGEPITIPMRKKRVERSA